MALGQERENTSMTINAQVPRPAGEKRRYVALRRVRANFLRFWTRCETTICRRARTCASDPDICMSQLASAIPADVRKGVDTLIEAKRRGESFEDALAKARHVVLAYCKWIDDDTERLQQSGISKQGSGVRDQKGVAAGFPRARE
jgi:hypothetical protein